MLIMLLLLFCLIVVVQKWESGGFRVGDNEIE